MKVFDEGIDVTLNQYKDDSRKAREIYQAGRHALENNNYRFTSLYTILSVGESALRKCDQDRPKAEMFLLAQFGAKSLSTVQRWIRVAQTTGTTVKETLREMKWLKPQYVLGNDYFMATGHKGHLRLREGYAKLALEAIKREAEEE